MINDGVNDREESSCLQPLVPVMQLALRAGNEKEEGETADTVGCCSLRVEHIQLYPKLEEREFVVEFDFLGKDSIRYYNKIPVEKRVSSTSGTLALEDVGAPPPEGTLLPANTLMKTQELEEPDWAAASSLCLSKNTVTFYLALNLLLLCGFPMSD